MLTHFHERHRAASRFQCFKSLSIVDRKAFGDYILKTRVYLQLLHISGVNEFVLAFLRRNLEGSEITFGGTDPEHYHEPITWIPLSSQLYWQISMDR